MEEQSQRDSSAECELIVQSATLIAMMLLPVAMYFGAKENATVWVLLALLLMTITMVVAMLTG